MGSAVLVDEKIKGGKALVEALDQMGFLVRSAFWLYSSEDDSWRLVIASPLVGELGQLECYGRVDAALLSLQEPPFALREIALVKETEQLVEFLRTAINTGPTGTRAIRWTRNSVGGIYVDDALIYRSS